MSRGLRLGLLLGGAALLGVGCDRDGAILWTDGDGGGDTIDTGTGTGTDSSTGTILEAMPFFPEGGPWPPPPPLECLGPDVPICHCPAGSSCACGGPPPPAPEPCQLICDGGDCQLSCHPESACDLTCDVGCAIVCEPFSSCNVSCHGGCAVLCQDGSFCTVWSSPGPTEVFCELGAICECPVPDGCICNGPGCPP